MEAGTRHMERSQRIAESCLTSPADRSGLESLGQRFDVCVVGGGPAGLATAIAAVQQGLTVAVVDGMMPPIDKACGEGLMPDTLAALQQLGVVLDPASGGAVIRGIRFLDAGSRAVAQAEFTAGAGRGMKRLALHQKLINRASELGVACFWQTVVQGMVEDELSATVHTNRGEIKARFVVGADGHASRVREWAGLGRASVSAKRIGLRQHFAIAPWTDLVEVYWSDQGQAYVTPVSECEVCVAFVARGKFADVSLALANFPELQSRLGTCPTSDTPRGSVTFSRKLRRVARGRMALVGDASGSVDAVTGEGLSLCFRQALALAAAMRGDNLATYESAHTAMRRLPHLMASTLLMMDRRPWLRNRSIRMLAAHPALFRDLLAAHTGDQPIRLLGPSGMLATGLELGLHLLIA